MELPDYNEAWKELLIEYTGKPIFDMPDLHEISDEHLVFLRSYIGRELSARTLGSNPDATETLHS